MQKDLKQNKTVVFLILLVFLLSVFLGIFGQYFMLKFYQSAIIRSLDQFAIFVSAVPSYSSSQ